MTSANKILMGSGAVAEPFEIEKSLIFSQTNDYLKRTPSSAGNRRTFTLSYWVKITTIDGTSRVIMTAGTSNSDVFHHNFESGGTPDDALRVVYYASSAFQINLTTNRVFRDPSAWYHIVLAIDTTQGTAANRVKMYVNGVQETSFATSVYPNQNLELNVNTATAHWLGQYHSADFPLKSYLAETHFIDGAAKAASDFGETNSDTGQWIPKEYTGGSYGTNGFYLPFNKTQPHHSSVFSGNNSYLIVTDDNSLTPGDTFTWEAWVYPTALYSYNTIASQDGSGGYYWSVQANGSMQFYSPSAEHNSAAGLVALNQWSHVAYSCSGGTAYFYCNGSRSGSAFSRNISNISANLHIGMINTTSWDFYGSMTDVRLVVGTSLYNSSTYTVPTAPLTAITNTVLLTCQSNPIVDASSSNQTVTVNGTYTPVGTSLAVPPQFTGIDLIGGDSSGNGNNYSAFNLANSNIVNDSPTNNFATWNPAIPTPYYVFSDGNLKLTVPNQWRNGIATMGVSTGKWYWEQIVSPSNLQYCNLGFVTDTGLFDNWLAAGTYIGYKPWSWGYDGSNGKLWHNAAGGTQLTVAPTTEWKAAVALDLDNGKAWFSLNGVWMGTGANPSTGAGAAFTGLADGSTYYPATTIYNLNSTANFGQNGTFSGLATAQGNEDTNGIGDFFYPVPSGFSALCTKNLPDPAIPLPSEHFNTLLYNGSGNTTNNVTGVGFQPDLVWIKRGNVSAHPSLQDSLRGPNKTMAPSTINVETSDSGAGLSAFTSDGFTVYEHASAQGVINSGNMISWNWKANGSGYTDTSGDIDAVVSANQAAGFSIVTWTSNGTDAGTVPHGLGVTPEIVIYKRRNSTSPWYVFINGLIDGSLDYMHLDSTNIKQNSLSQWGTPSSSMISNIGWSSGDALVAYNFVSKPAFSKMGVYTGNGSSTDGPFVDLGFKPAWVVTKNTSVARAWLQSDNKNNPSNVVNKYISLDQDAAVDTYAWADFLSNGFKVRNNGASVNTDGNVYLYLALAESPFKSATGR